MITTMSVFGSFNSSLCGIVSIAVSFLVKNDYQALDVDGILALNLCISLKTSFIKG